MDTKGGKPQGGGDGGVMNWGIGIDMYTLMCIKLMNNKNLLYKKRNKCNSKIQKKKIIENISQTKSWFFEKINKMDKPLAKLTKKKRQ